MKQNPPHQPQAQNKTRSPRFPFIPIGQALKHTRTLHEHFGNDAVPAFKAMKALGFEGMSGKANKVIAALRAYGLIGVEKVEKGRRVTVSPLGAKLSKAPRAPKHRQALRLAALAPMPFRNLWHNRPGVTEEQLVTLLRKRDFTEQGAKRAARVYMANVRFAQLEDPDFRKTNVVPAMPQRPARPAAAKLGVAGPDPAGAAAGGRRLQVPLGDKVALIPVGIREDDFKLLMQTLRLWKSSLVGKAA